MEFPLTLWPEWIATKSPTSSIFSQNTTPWMLCSTMEQVQYKIMEPFSS
jgi:hypothetical protein